MKKPLIRLAGLLCTLLIFFSFYHYCFLRENKEGIKEEETSSNLSGANKQMNMWWWSRAYPEPYHITSKYLKAWEKAKQMKNELLTRTSRTSRTSQTTADVWKPIGPKTLGGRMLCVAINPLRHTTLLSGSASGGIWRSYHGGVGTNVWEPVKTGFPTLGVTSILYHPSDTNTIYAATGEVYRVDSTVTTPNPSNTGSNVWKTRGTYSVGLLKSTNGGASWTRVFIRELADLFGIQKIRFHPSNPAIVFICATDGLYQYNSTTGTTTKLLSITYVSDVLINPLNPDVIVVGVGNLGNTLKGVYRTTNSSAATPAWSKITSGLPTSFQGFINFDIHTGSNTIFASIGRGGSVTVELYRSTDFGLTWSGISNTGHPSFQYWFSHAAGVDPNNVNRVFIAGVNLYRLSISGTTGTRTHVNTGSATMGTYLAEGVQEGSTKYVHSDIHDVEYVPGRSDSVYFCTDGGVFLSINAGVSTATNITFQSCNSGLQTAQFFGPVGQSATDANFFLGGLQDNNTAVYNGATGRWKREIGGDGGPSAIKPDDDNIVLSSRDARAVYRSTNKGASFGSAVANYWGSVADSRTGFMAPLAWSKSSTSIVYLASDNLHKSTDAGVNFSFEAYGTASNYIEARNKTAIALAVSPINSKIILASTSPFAQYDNDADNIYFNPPPNFLKTTTGNTPFTSIYGGGLPTPNRYVMDIAFHPTRDSIIWIVLGGFGSSHVFKSIDAGTTWVDMDNANLPDVPTNAIMIDPNNSNIVYVGNDLGIYVTGDGGITWNDYNGGLWDATMVMDLVSVPGDKIRAATHGKGIYEAALYNVSTLPVRLLSFTGEVEGEVNSLRWTVASESSLTQYEVQRSSNGNEFKKLSILNARNNLEQASYNYNDKVNVSNFYRLKLIHVDGQLTYSDVILIQRTNSQGIRVLTNPFAGSIRLQCNFLQSGTMQISFYNMGGQLIKRATQGVVAGEAVYTIPELDLLPKGTYTIEATVNQKRWVQKVVKQ